MSTRDGSASLDAPEEHKARIRTRVRARRANLDPAGRTVWSATITERLLAAPQLRTAQSVFIYIATAEEVQTRDIIEQCCGQGKTVYVPQVIGKAPMRAVPFPGWDTLVDGVLGIPSPPDVGADAAQVDLVVVPGLAFDTDGGRLGYGGGYYDRWLAAHPRAIRLALSFEAQIEAAIPLTAHDIRMHHVLTEQRWITCRDAHT